MRIWDAGSLWLRGAGAVHSGKTPSISCASLPSEVDDFSWEPPTEAETKVLQARRERQDRISRLMGDYLLRGYRMLGETCADCGVRRDLGRGVGDGAADQAVQPFPSSPPLDPIVWRLTPAPVFLAPRRSSSKTNSGKSIAWLVRSSTQTWIKIIRVKDRVCLVEKQCDDRGLGMVGVGGDCGVWLGPR